MADPIRDKIIQAVKAALAAIAAPYESTVQGVFRAGELLLNVDEYPAIVITDRGDAQRKHLRGVYENRMTLELHALVREGVAADRVLKISKLSADVQKKLLEDETFGGLAKKTFLRATQPQIGELDDPLGYDFLTVEILYRVERKNPYTQTEI